MKDNLTDIGFVIKALRYTSTESNVNISCKELRKNIQKALLIIPGYVDNIKLITTLNACLIDLKVGGINSSEKDREHTFNQIRSFIIENLSKVKLSNTHF